MIRALFLLLFLVAGLAGAAIFQGQMHHLRQAVPDRLPEWTSMVAADAGLRRGQADLPAKGRWPATRLDWTARLPTSAGWVWDVTLVGEGVALTGTVTLTFAGDTATFSDVSGSIDLAALPDMPVSVQGIARIASVSGDVTDLLGSLKASGALTGAIVTLVLDGADFGGGPLTANLEMDGNWRAEMALKDGVSPVQAEMKGIIANPVAQLQIGFADGPALPPIMRAMLAAVGQPDAQGWQVSLAVPVP